MLFFLIQKKLKIDGRLHESSFADIFREELHSWFDVDDAHRHGRFLAKAELLNRAEVAGHILFLFVVSY